MNPADRPAAPLLAALCLALALAACKKEAPESGTARAEPAPPAQNAVPPAPAPQAPAPAASPPAAPAAPTAGVERVAIPMDFGLKLPCLSNPPAEFSSFKSRPLVVFYFSPTCPHCQQAMPVVQDYGDGLRARGIETVALASSRSNPEEIQGFIRSQQARIPVFWDAERRFGDAYGIKLLPTLFLVGAQGRMYRLEHFAGKASLDSLLARL